MDKKAQTGTNEAIFNNLKSVLKGISEMFGRHCEVVIHTIEDLEHSIIAIENGHITGREIGAPMTDFALQLLEKADHSDSDVVSNYNSKTEDGKRLKSTTILIRDVDNKPIGVLCINFDLSAPLDEYVKDFFLSGEKRGLADGQVEEHYPATVKDLITASMDKVFKSVNAKKGIASTERNRLLVSELYDCGVFNVKNGVDIVAEQLGISRYTVYNYLRDLKIRNKSS